MKTILKVSIKIIRTRNDKGEYIVKVFKNSITFINSIPGECTAYSQLEGHNEQTFNTETSVNKYIHDLEITFKGIDISTIYLES